MSVASYIENISKRYALGNATEHTFRGDLQHLIEELVPEVAATNEPKRIDCGAPDYVITRKDIPVGYIEAKDVGKDLDAKELKEQFDRYRDALDNLAFTDYLTFRFYQNGQPTDSIQIGELSGGRIIGFPNNFDGFTARLKEFCSRTTQTIKGSQKLAEMMADKAKILAFTIKAALDSDEVSEENSTLREQMKAFKEILIHDIDSKQFADIYAQTIAYGMFAARLHDKSLDSFTRQEAAELIPKTNPFLRKLFQYIAGYDLDTRIDWIVDLLADLFRATDIASILKNFGKTRRSQDPIIHFYETFLAEYDPKLRKSRGVFYTPEPVVNFIVRAVDDILKSEFDLPQGLADTKKTKVSVDQGGKLFEKELHKVQILDPAAGTGTFLAEVITHIYKSFRSQRGSWSDYVENHLIPRLNGFELLMTSYAMAHLKLDLLLADTGYQGKKEQRFHIYLTNALEEHQTDAGGVWDKFLANEANEANAIKRDTPVMVVLGNPPYSLSSSNKGAWIEKLVADYKVDLEEQNLNALSDDYVKFVRYAQWLIQKTGRGIVAIISNNSFIDGITQRMMRKDLLETFDKIYIYDLHGSTKRKEKAPDGTKDENVFDIQQGVSVSILVKRQPEKSQEKTVLHYDSYGLRKIKYQKMLNDNLSSVNWTQIQPQEPYFFFVPKDAGGLDEYNTGFLLTDLFIKSGNGIKFRKDNLLVKNMFSDEDVRTMLQDINRLPIEQIYLKYDFRPTPDWRLEDKKRFFVENDFSNIIKVDYRQFDARFTYYPISSINEIIVRGDSRRNLMQNYFTGTNHGLVVGRQGQVVGDMPWNLVFICSTPTDMNIFYRGGGINFPLYLYPEHAQPTLDGRIERSPNFNVQITQQFAESVGLTFVDENEGTSGTFTPIAVLDYIYAVLHSPNYREKYKEFLSVDFPRVPYPKNADTFWQLVALGGELRQIHLLESPNVNKFITGYPIGGDNVMGNPTFVTNPLANASGSDSRILGDVFINADQYFSNVPEIVWNFYIGGYQPAQKWLKDRKGRKLSYDDIRHYQKIIVALTETDRIMKEIDKIDFMG